MLQTIWRQQPGLPLFQVRHLSTPKLPITDEVSTHVGSDLLGVLLGLVEVYQRQERWEDAIASMERLQRLEPNDVLVEPAFADLLFTARLGDKTNRQVNR